MSVQNMGASIRNRLLDKARTEKLDFNLLLTRYALERMLYRLSISAQYDQFLLKGALLFDLWFYLEFRKELENPPSQSCHLLQTLNSQ